jgi:hypothetical protein
MQHLLSRARITLPQTREGRIGLLFALLALSLVSLAAVLALQPVLANWTTWGSHDWDQITAYRYVMIKSFREFGQFPLWNPFTCGGHSAWANVQEVSNLVSPFMPLYLLLDLRHALRLELLGTVVIGIWGTWLMAAQYTRSAALCGLVCVCFVLNGRWAMQVATGHDWHWYYALTPWLFLFFDRALRAEDAKRRLSSLVLGGLVVALLVYTCAIYPLPQSLTLLGIYALALSAYARFSAGPRPEARTWTQPLRILIAITLIGVGLAGPKLLPALELMARFPRAVESTEFVELRTLVVALTAWGQSPNAASAPIPQWGWHEYGIYVGWIPFLAMLALAPYAAGDRARSLRVAALVALVLGLGAFHPYAPWTLLHKLPLYSSQHVPSRWLHPGVLLFAVIAVSVSERALSARKRRWPFEAGLLLLLGYVAFDVSYESGESLRGAFGYTMRQLPPPGEYFQVKEVPAELQYDRRGYAPESMPAMLTNRGVIDCTMMPAQSVWGPKDANGRVIGIGARGRDEPDYRGEVFTKSGRGALHITSWSPNAIEVSFTGAAPGDLLVLNQNWDPGWRVNDTPAENEADRVGFVLPSAQGSARFAFWPRGLGWGIFLFMLTVAALFAAPWWQRRQAAKGAPQRVDS